MGGKAALPVVPCITLMEKVREENRLLDSFTGALRAGVRWGEYRLGDDKIVEDLREQKTRIEQILEIMGAKA